MNQGQSPAGHLPPKSGFSPRSVRVGFLVDEATFCQLSLQVPEFCPVSVMATVLLFICVFVDVLIQSSYLLIH